MIQSKLRATNRCRPSLKTTTRREATTTAKRVGTSSPSTSSTQGNHGMLLSAASSPLEQGRCRSGCFQTPTRTVGRRGQSSHGFLAVLLTVALLLVGAIAVVLHERLGQSSSAPSSFPITTEWNPTTTSQDLRHTERTSQITSREYGRILAPLPKNASSSSNSSVVTATQSTTLPNLSWLLNFAIVGFPKCGTSSLMYQLHDHDQVDMFVDERCELGYNQQDVLIRDLVTHFVLPHVRDGGGGVVPPNSTATDKNLPPPTVLDQVLASPPSSTVLDRRHRGLKCPADMESTALALPHYAQYFPDTKFVIGLRHPILWFESFYNFRVHNGFPMPPPESLVGGCRKGMYSCCTYRATFHLFLAQGLGKTNLTREELQSCFAPSLQRTLLQQQEQQRNPLLQPASSEEQQHPHRHRPIFLYEVSQMNNQNAERTRAFLSDLQHFLGLTHAFGTSTTTTATTTSADQQDPLVTWFRPGVSATNRTTTTTTTTTTRHRPTMDICESPRFDALRRGLLEQARNASHWLVHYFLPQAPEVTVSSRSYLVQSILNKQWKRDPCLKRRQQQQPQLG